eukprot:364667-Chlamydomonas_euryale.AAC.3
MASRLKLALSLSLGPCYATVSLPTSKRNNATDSDVVMFWNERLNADGGYAESKAASTAYKYMRPWVKSQDRTPRLLTDAIGPILTHAPRL